MITLTTKLPDSGREAITDTFKKIGGNILYMDSDEDLTPTGFELLQESYKEHC